MISVTMISASLLHFGVVTIERVGFANQRHGLLHAQTWIHGAHVRNALIMLSFIGISDYQRQQTLVVGSDDDVAAVGGDGQATDGIVDCVLSQQLVVAVAAHT